MHIHLVHFKVLSRNGGGPRPPTPAGRTPWTCDRARTRGCSPGFDGYRGRYVFHCHNLEHEDMMMMANFEVV